MAMLAIVLSLGPVACGSGGHSGSPSRPASSSATPEGVSTPASGGPAGSYLKVDGDKDNDDSDHPISRLDDDGVLLNQYGGKASRADRQAVAAVLEGYYAAAAAEEGAKACALLDPSLAEGLAVAPRPGAGKTCAAGVSALYKQQHAQLAADAASMVVTEVRVKGDLGLAVLGFRAKPEGEILVERERGAWKVDALFDSQLP
jgi:hypothetical protein